MFVDHYAVLGCSPEAPLEDVRHAYHDRLRQFHPDKRRTQSRFGVLKTQALNEAWEALRTPEERAAYDVLWQREHRKTNASGALEKKEPSPKSGTSEENAQAAEERRLDGSRHYREAQSIMNANRGRSTWKAAVVELEAARREFSEGIRLAPDNHRLWLSRGLCQAALQDWSQCREDALRLTQLQPYFVKGWALLVKATRKGGSPAAAQAELHVALRILPDNPDLLALQAQFLTHADTVLGHEQPGYDLPRVPPRRLSVSRNMSPCGTPSGSPCGFRNWGLHVLSDSPLMDVSPGWSNTPPISRSGTPSRNSLSRSSSLPRSGTPSQCHSGTGSRSPSLPKLLPSSGARGLDGAILTPPGSPRTALPRPVKACDTFADRCKATDDEARWIKSSPNSRSGTPPVVHRRSHRNASPDGVQPKSRMHRHVAAALLALGAEA